MGKVNYVNEKEEYACESTKKALFKLREYGINQDCKPEFPSTDNNWTATIKFSVPETSLVTDKLGEYCMNKREDMIAIFKEVMFRGLLAEASATGNCPPAGRTFDSMIKFLCRVRKNEIWTNAMKSYIQAQNKIMEETDNA